jgi:hypothetical protein
MRLYVPLRRPLRLRHARRPLHPRHARPRPLRPPPSATSRPDSAAAGAACHLVLRRRSMSSRRSSHAGLALQRRQILHLRRHHCLRVPSPCPPSSSSTPWRLGQSAVFVFPPSSPPLPCLRFRRRTAGALRILPGAPPCWKSMMLYCRITLGTWCHVPPGQCCHWKVDLQAQVLRRRHSGTVQGALGSSGIHTTPRCRLRGNFQPGCQTGDGSHCALPGSLTAMACSPA